MSSRVLTPDVVGIDALVHDHQTVLAKAEGGMVAVFANNAPAFYAVTPSRLAELLALEEKLTRPGSDVALDDQLYQEPQTPPLPYRWENSPCTRTGGQMLILLAWPHYGAWR